MLTCAAPAYSDWHQSDQQGQGLRYDLRAQCWAELNRGQAETCAPISRWGGSQASVSHPSHWEGSGLFSSDGLDCVPSPSTDLHPARSGPLSLGFPEELLPPTPPWRQSQHLVGVFSKLEAGVRPSRSQQEPGGAAMGREQCGSHGPASGL
jgi:hypothetical protein